MAGDAAAQINNFKNLPAKRMTRIMIRDPPTAGQLYYSEVSGWNYKYSKFFPECFLLLTYLNGKNPTIVEDAGNYKMEIPLNDGLFSDFADDDQSRNKVKQLLESLGTQTHEKDKYRFPLPSEYYKINNITLKIKAVLQLCALLNIKSKLNRQDLSLISRINNYNEQVQLVRSHFGVGLVRVQCFIAGAEKLQKLPGVFFKNIQSDNNLLELAESDTPKLKNRTGHPRIFLSRLIGYPISSHSIVKYSKDTNVLCIFDLFSILSNIVVNGMVDKYTTQPKDIKLAMVMLRTKGFKPDVSLEDFRDMVTQGELWAKNDLGVPNYATMVKGKNMGFGGWGNNQQAAKLLQQREILFRALSLLHLRVKNIVGKILLNMGFMNAAMEKAPNVYSTYLTKLLSREKIPGANKKEYDTWRNFIKNAKFLSEVYTSGNYQMRALYLLLYQNINADGEFQYQNEERSGFAGIYDVKSIPDELRQPHNNLQELFNDTGFKVTLDDAKEYEPPFPPHPLYATLGWLDKQPGEPLTWKKESTFSPEDGVAIVDKAIFGNRSFIGPPADPKQNHKGPHRESIYEELKDGILNSYVNKILDIEVAPGGG